MLTVPVRPVLVVVEDLVPEHVVVAPRKPRVSPLDRLLHLQAGMQAQVLRGRVRSLHGIVLRTTACCRHEQAVLVYTWRVEPGTAHVGRPEERMLHLVLLPRYRVADIF